MAKFELKSFVGLSDFENKGIAGAFKFGSALDVRKKVDSLSCQQALVDEGEEIIVDLILWQVPCSDGNTYGFGDTGKIYKRTPAGDYGDSAVYTEPGGKIIGAEEWFNDEGKAFLYWADANQELHRKEIPGESDWSDVDDDEGWPKSNLDDTEWHTMRIAMGVLAICNGQYLAAVDFYDQYSNVVTNFLPGNLAKTLIEYNNRILVGTVSAFNRESGQLFIWEDPGDITKITSYTVKKKIPTKGINALIEGEYPLMQGGDTGGVFYSDLINVLPITSFPGGGQVNPDGVDVDEGLALFGVFGGVDIDGKTSNGIYTLGRKGKNRSFALNLDYPLECDEIGSVKNIGTDILVSYRIGEGAKAVYGVKRVDSENKAEAVYQSLDLIAPAPFAKPVVWEAVKLTTKEMPTETAIEVWYRMNKEGNFVQAKMEGEIAQFESGTEAIFLVGSEGRIAEVLVKLIPNENDSPEVYPPIEIFFS